MLALLCLAVGVSPRDPAALQAIEPVAAAAAPAAAVLPSLTAASLLAAAPDVLTRQRLTKQTTTKAKEAKARWQRERKARQREQRRLTAKAPSPQKHREHQKEAGAAAPGGREDAATAVARIAANMERRKAKAAEREARKEAAEEPKEPKEGREEAKGVAKEEPKQVKKEPKEEGKEAAAAEAEMKPLTRSEAQKAQGTCECSITAAKLGKPPLPRKPPTAHHTPTRFLFVLGFPFTGTTAVHDLIGQLSTVSMLGNAKLGSPSKSEGWRQNGWAKQKSDAKWGNPDAFFDWGKLRSYYMSLWNQSQPLLLEKSPPETIRADALHSTFSALGKVRFIVVAHSMCAHDGKIGTLGCDHPTDAKSLSAESRQPGFGPIGSEIKGDSFGECWSARGDELVGIAERYGDDAFLIRYEDLCFSWTEVISALAKWEPLLSDLAKPQANEAAQVDLHVASKTKHPHGHMSIRDYCQTEAVPKWTAGNMHLVTPVEPASAGWGDVHQKAAKALGYDRVDACK